VGVLRVTFVGHATVLVQWAGTNLLVDPIWSSRAGPFPWLGLRRHQPPGLRFDDLPTIHAVLLTHDHHDHCDLPTLRRLHARSAPRLIAPRGMGAWLARQQLPDAHELDWWGDTSLPDGSGVIGVPAQHTSGRAPWSRRRTLWAGFVVESPSGRIYVSGDTGVGPHLAEIAARFPTPRLAVLPIGCYRPPRCMAPIHLSPADAVALHRQLDAGTSVGVHFGTFAQAGDGPDDAPCELAEALAACPAPAPNVLTLVPGEAHNVT